MWLGNFLINFGRRLVKGLFQPSANSELKFLSQVLQATNKSGGNPNVIYPMLRDNINLINDNFAIILLC